MQIFDLGNGYTVEFDDDPESDFPICLYRGEEQIDFFEDGRHAISELDFYQDDIIPPEKWSDLWDWCLSLETV